MISKRKELKGIDVSSYQGKILWREVKQFGIDFGAAITQIRHMIDRDHLPAKILGASYKNVGQLVRSVDCGAHAVTAQPAMLRAALQSALVVDAVRTFNANQAWIDGKE